MINSLFQEEITLKKDKEFKQRFKERPENFRINAVIHDGQWYDIKKWAKVAMTTKEKIEEFIENNKEILIKKNESYRVGYDEVIKWYSDNNIDLTEDIVPNNFTPKLWGGKTEAEHFENAPKRIVTCLIFYCSDDTITKKIKKITYGYGKFQNSTGNRCNIYSSNALFLKNKIISELTKEELKKVTLRIRSNFKWRELTDFSEDFLTEALKFYVVYAMGILKPHRKTMEIFLPSREDQIAQVYDWVISAMQKFDEEASVPFSGYLSTVLQRWPYDLPDIVLGRDLAKYQRDKSKIVNELTQNFSSIKIDDEEIFSRLSGYTREQFEELRNADNHWNGIRNATELQWKDNGNEKKVSDEYYTHESSESSSSNAILANNLSIAVLKATCETKDLDSFFNILEHFGGALEDLAKLEISNEFKVSLAKHIGIK